MHAVSLYCCVKHAIILIVLFSAFCLVACTDSVNPRIPTENELALRKCVGADSCTIDLDAKAGMIRARIVNPAEKWSYDSVVWRTSSLAAIQVYALMNSNFTIWDSIEIALIQAKPDLNWNAIQRFSTHDVCIVDSLIPILEGIVRGDSTIDPERIKNHFDSTQVDLKMISGVDSVMETKNAYSISNIEYGLSGFAVGNEIGTMKAMLFISIFERGPTFYNEYQFIVNPSTGLINGLNVNFKEARPVFR